MDAKSEQPSTPRSDVMILHPGERLTMKRDLAVGVLVIHRGRIEATSIDRAGHQLAYDELEIMGQGKAEIRNGDRTEIASESDGDARVVLRR